ncbi:MAG: hypothetical protein KatS3mg108_3831 [Isosphaeraceae bacterium]|jgi:tetratricopeptide (TPR) repeat protein|nr:MAG: hypothetical protein KatS3mg108_3831 [Isosphaeraceae bacterium]
MMTRALAVAGSTLLVVGLAVVGRADVVRLITGSTVKVSGGQISGTIVSESPLEVRIKPAVGPEQTIPVDQIDQVTYDGVPPSFALAESRLGAGNLQEAAELFGKAAAEAKGKANLERAAQYGRAAALAELGLVDSARAGEAIKALEEFVRTQPNARQLGSALLTLARLSLAQGDTERAAAVLADLKARVPWAAGRAAVLEARVMARKGDHEGSIAALDALVAAAPAGSAQAREAILAKAESLVATRRFAEAEAVVQRVIAESDPEDDAIQAEAHNMLGDCLRAAGRPKDALIAYLKTDVLYDGARDQHARALAQIAELWTELKQDARAAEVRARLRQLYPQSPYAKAG